MLPAFLHDDLGWKNQTTGYILPRHWLYEWFSLFHSCGTYSVLSRSHSFIFPHSHHLCQCIVHKWLCDFQCWLNRSFMDTSHQDTLVPRHFGTGAEVLRQFIRLKGHLSDRSLVQDYPMLSTFKAFTDQYTIPSQRPLQIRPEQLMPSLQNCHAHSLKIPRNLANLQPIWRLLAWPI